MARSFESLQAEIMNLSSAERFRLIEHLVASLDQNAETEAAWDRIALERASQLEGNDASAVPLEEVLRRLETRFPR